MKWLLLIPALAVGALVAVPPPPAVADDKCSLVAEVTVAAVKSGSLQICTKTGHPVACAIAAAANSVAGEAAASVAKKGVEAGCEWAVEKIGNAIRVKVDAPKKNEKQLNQTKDELQKSKDLKLK